MDGLTEDIARVALTGVGATAFMDAWLWCLKRMNVPALNFALIGRWVGHWRHGQWMHDSIAKAPPVRGEKPLGWTVHYLTGIAFAGLSASLYGQAWMHSPRILPALAVGIGTAAFPLFVMQPALGAGIASSKTPAPLRSCIRSIANHAVFGLGLYLAALLIAWVSP